MDKGWIKLHRVIMENHFLMHDINAFAVFTKLLMLVGKAKGEWSGGRKQLAEIMDMKENTLYGVLQRLEKEQIINRQPNNRYTVYSICNWRKYQQPPQQLTQPGDNNATTTRQHYNKNKKENKNIGIDLKLAEKEQAAKTRIGSSEGYLNAKAIAEEIKRRALK